MPIERSSRHHSLLDFAFVNLVSWYFLFAVSRGLEANERRCLFSSVKWAVRDWRSLECTITFLHFFKIAGLTHGFILWVILMVRIGASLSKVVCKAVVIWFSIVSIVFPARGSGKSSSNLFANSVRKVAWPSFECWRVFIVTGGGLGWA